MDENKIPSPRILPLTFTMKYTICVAAMTKQIRKFIDWVKNITSKQKLSFLRSDRNHNSYDQLSLLFVIFLHTLPKYWHFFEIVPNITISSQKYNLRYFGNDKKVIFIRNFQFNVTFDNITTRKKLKCIGE